MQKEHSGQFTCLYSEWCALDDLQCNGIDLLVQSVWSEIEIGMRSEFGAPKVLQELFLSLDTGPGIPIPPARHG